LPDATAQADEVREREAIARREYPDLLVEIGRHHSIPVMDREVRWFLDRIPANGVVADIGGGWGWHWRRLGSTRPDVCVVIVDFVRENLRQAARMLTTLVGTQVFLVHGDATKLPFPSGVFDGYWSVQTLQHIPSIEHAVREAHRVLRPHGEFASYSLNRATLIEAVYRILRKPYHVAGKRSGSFHLVRGSRAHADLVGRVFGSPVVSRYTEILFHPDLTLHTGGASSRVGTLDARLSSSLPFLACAARQRSYHTRKAS
jgi:SAM-dependent methyltransferase